MITWLKTPRGPAARRPRRTAAAAARRALVLLLAASTLAGCGYSRIHELDDQALVARSDIEIQLLRRAELAPTLVETAQRYTQLDSTVVEAVADSRAGLVAAVRATDLSAMEAASLSLSDALSELLSAVAGYAELQADPGFQRLLVQLEATRQQVVLAGRSYNEAVRLYNEYIGGFPQVLTAKIIGAESRRPFGTPESTDSDPPADG
ncbi:MAG: hypothetical protein GTO46_06390 [Gemmatimonadetes bacterium]|nr:hypothetical protein [Gemmatimonadota bacterium]NIO31264.1 hypothetical protein [Gemmatimonadota bacterium]